MMSLLLFFNLCVSVSDFWYWGGEHPCTPSKLVPLTLMMSWLLYFKFIVSVADFWYCCIFWLFQLNFCQKLVKDKN